MRMEPHTIKIPTWTQSAYGEPMAAYGEPDTILMKMGWNSMVDQDNNGSLYKEFDFVGLTRAFPEVGSLVDDKYIIGHVEPGRFNRVFMRHAEGKERDYGE